MTTRTKFEEFVDAQDEIYDQVRRELAEGRKKSHWIWFVFPQLTGLGSSPMSSKFGVDSTEEARSYWQHPILGQRLRECTQLLLQLPQQDIRSILDFPDNLKFRSCMTLFAAAAPHETIFKDALNKFFAGKQDPLTLELLSCIQ